MRYRVAFLSVLVACISAAAVCTVLGESYSDVVITNVPHIRQKPDFCGEACVEMWLKKLGRKGTQDDVFNVSRVNPAYGRGCWTRDLNEAMLALNIFPGDTWYEIRPDKADSDLEVQWKALHADLVAGIPSIACMRYSDAPDAPEHFRLILGYASNTDEVIFNEPAEDNGAYRRMKRSTFFKIWPLKDNPKKWIAVRLRCKAGPEKVPEPAKGFSDADFAQHVMGIKKKIGSAKFVIVVQPPFVVIGDEARAAVESRSSGTVKWAADALKREYFEKDPERILDVWLFQGKESYETYTKSLFGHEPTTPFGFYSDQDDALIMNIATGGGTLVHEIVHPYIKANFPGCPAWFNEGLGSLYEQSGEKDGHIVGFTNWRLAGLKKAIKADGLPGFEELTGTSSSEFYGEDRGSNYAQARYLCYYLQEKKLLTRFYKEFFKNRKTDPTGYKTLKEVLGVNDMAKFKKDWEKFVLALTFP